MSLFCRGTIIYTSAHALKTNDKTTMKVYLPSFECENLKKRLNKAIRLHVKFMLISREIHVKNFT